MKSLLTCGLLVASVLAFGQPDTDVYIAELTLSSKAIVVKNPFNVSNNPGYDNQPSFRSDGEILLFAKTRKGQTDIYSYDPESGHGGWLTNTPGGSEYSPMEIPDTNSVSAIRLDTTGLQRLYRYEFKDRQKSKLLFDDLKIGYHLWFRPDILVCTVLTENRMDLVVAYPEDQTANTYQKQVGRSLQRIPGRDLISYVSLEDEKPILKSMDPISGSTAIIAPLPEGIQDVCWLPNGLLLCGGDGILQLWDPEKSDWTTAVELGNDFGQISRIAVNKQGTLIALVKAKTQRN